MARSLACTWTKKVKIRLLFIKLNQPFKCYTIIIKLR
jgi:hypothetical protein